MQGVLRGLLVVLLAAVTVGGPVGCSNKEGSPNPELKIPDVPPSPRGGGKGVLKSDLKAPNKDANEKASPEK